MSTTTATHQYWQDQVSNWQHSGLSGPVFCKQQDLVYHRFAYWRKKFTHNESTSAFAQVACVSGSHATEGLSLMLPNGIEIRGIMHGNVALVKALLRGL